MGERSYGRFYSLLKQMPGADKETLVEQFTNGRTVHLHLMTGDEYNRMCNAMEEVTGYAERKAAMQKELKRKRSMCLHLMQQLGVNTADWPTVDNFCKNPRVNGKRFARLTLDELDELQVKLRMIKKHGGLKGKEEKEKPLHSSGIQNRERYYLLLSTTDFNTSDYGKKN